MYSEKIKIVDCLAAVDFDPHLSVSPPAFMPRFYRPPQ